MLLYCVPTFITGPREGHGLFTLPVYVHATSPSSSLGVFSDLLERMVADGAFQCERPRPQEQERIGHVAA